MSFVVVDQQGREVGRFSPEDWREACRLAWSVDGRVHTEGGFQS